MVAFATLVLAPGGSSGTGNNREQVRLNSADQAAARASVIRKADLGSSAWAGGAVKPNLAATPACPGYNPKQSDLVLTGAASSQFSRSGVNLRSDAQVLRTRSMVAADWRRTVVSKGTVACLRRMLAAGLPPDESLVSFGQTSFAPLARYSTRFRGILAVYAQGRRALALMDIVLIGRSRTELTLTVIGPAAAKQSLSAAEVRLARVLLVRARA